MCAALRPPSTDSQTSSSSGKSADKQSDLENLLVPFLKSVGCFYFSLILWPILEASALWRAGPPDPTSVAMKGANMRGSFCSLAFC